MSTTGTAEVLIVFAGGPPIIGALVLSYLGRTLSGGDRIPRKGWTALAAGALLVAWLGLFLLLATPAVWEAWTAPGPIEPMPVLLTATWIIAAVMLAVLLVNSRAVFRYLDESYPPGAGPWPVRLCRRLPRG